MSSHVLCLDDHKIFFFGFSVHVGKSCFNYSYDNGGGEKQSGTDTNSVCSCFHGYMQILVYRRCQRSEEFESLTKIILEVTYLDLIRSALKL